MSHGYVSFTSLLLVSLPWSIPSSAADIGQEVKAVLETKRHCNREAIKGMDAVFQYQLTGEDGGTYHVVLKDGVCKVLEGTHPKPNVTETMSTGDFLEIESGRLNRQMAFMSGRLKIAGDMGLVMKEHVIFEHAPPQE